MFGCSHIKLTDSEIDHGGLVYIKNYKPTKRTHISVPNGHTAVLLRDGSYFNVFSEGEYVFVDKKRQPVKSGTAIFISKNKAEDIGWCLKTAISIGETSRDTVIRGLCCVVVDNSRKFFEAFVGENTVQKINISEVLRDRIGQDIQTIIARLIATDSLNWEILDDSERLSVMLKPKLSELFLKDYGLDITLFNIAMLR